MHIILYVLDALRADHLGCYGYGRPTSPHIDQLAEEGVLFENCFTSTTWTRPVAASLLTGVYPAVHGTRSRYDLFNTPLIRLPEALGAGGYKTAAFSTMGNVASAIGFARGFDDYYDLFAEPELLARRQTLDAAREGLMHETTKEVALPLAEDINQYLFPWLAANKTAVTFSFIWSIETHEPYRAPEAFRHFATRPLRPGEGESSDIRAASPADADRLRDLYDDEIRYNDHCLGELVAYLKEIGIYDETLLIITGDHGEAFYEHGVYTHGHTPYEELIHVPLILKFPNGWYAGQRIPALVELIDIYPTLVAVAGLEAATVGATAVQGHSLLPLLDGSQTAVRQYTFSDSQSLAIHNHYLSIRDERWKYVQVKRPLRHSSTLFDTLRHLIARRMLGEVLRHPRHFLRNRRGAQEYLFDLHADPGEQHNLASQQSDQLDHYRQHLAAWQFQNELLARQVGPTNGVYQEDEHLRQHLERLGYL
jgi:arylsulfatase A-like enzyme